VKSFLLLSAVPLCSGLLLGAGCMAQERPQQPSASLQMTTEPAYANPSGRPLTLEEAEATGLKNNPQITVGKLIALQAHEFVRETRSALMPQVNVNVSAIGTDGGSRLSAGYLTDGRMYSRVAGGIEASQLITDFGRTWNLLSSSKFRAEAADQNAIATKQQIILAVDQEFYSALETKALLSVAEDTVKARQLFADQIKALTDSKLKSDVDLAFAKVDLARAKLLLLDAQDNYQA
jgi:outer membrane protein